MIICSLSSQISSQAQASDPPSTIDYSKKLWVKQRFNPKTRCDVSPADLSSRLLNEISPSVYVIKACMRKDSVIFLSIDSCWSLSFWIIYFEQMIEYRNSNLLLVLGTICLSSLEAFSFVVFYDGLLNGNRQISQLYWGFPLENKDSAGAAQMTSVQMYSIFLFLLYYAIRLNTLKLYLIFN